MSHYDHLEAVPADQRPTLLTIGVFDGVHIGHQALIQHLLQQARQAGMRTAVLTFFPHPDIVLRGLSGPYYLTPPAERAQYLLDLGIDMVITHPFDETVRNQRAQAFLERLLSIINLRSLWVGQDFALGYQREGDVAFLRAQGMLRGFDVQTIDLLVANGDSAVSSSLIRGHIQVGDMASAGRLLGRPYGVKGVVVQGDQRGRTIGFPTANLDIWSEWLLPAFGVYAGWATVGDVAHMAVTNVGVRPTFDGQRATVEAHLLDFAGDLYGQTMYLTFEHHLRAEQRFTGIDALVAQLTHDVQIGREWLVAQKSGQAGF